MKNKFLIALKKTWNQFRQSLPIIFGVLLLISLIQALIPSERYASLFSGNFLDPLIGSAVGSIASGNPVTSYIIGGELLKNDVSMIAVTAFVVSWVTVGVIQFPAESLMLGKRFALTRNILALISSVVITIFTATILKILNVY